MKTLFFKDAPVVGLDISQTGLKIMSINIKHWTVEAYGSIDLDPAELQRGLDTDSDYLAKNIRMLIEKNVVGKLHSNHVVISIPTGRTYGRTVSLPSTIKGSLLEAIQLEAEQYIPVPLSQLYIDYEVSDKTDTETNVLMCAVPRKLIDNVTKAAADAGLIVTLIEPGINAVARALKATEEGDLPTVIVDIGAANTDIAILDGTIRVTGGLAIGGNTFTLTLADKMKLSLEAAHQLKVLNGLMTGNHQAKVKHALDPNLKQIANEVKKISRYYAERIPDAKKLEQVIIVGGGSNMPGIGEYFTNALVMAARVASPWQTLNFGKLPQPARQFKPRYITVAGLASVPAKEVIS